MPPIWMPTELMFANPHRAKVAMVKDRGSRWLLRSARSLNAMNSFRTMRSPSRLPMVPESCHGTPIANAIGRKIQLRTVWMFSGNQATWPCTHPKPPLTSATRAIKETSIAMTLSIRCSPSVVPRAAASTTLTSVRGISTRTPPSVWGVSVSGSRILAIMMVPGAVMITAVSRCRASMPMAMYAAMIDPDTCAIPAVMTVISSERVIPGRNGRMVSGASVWPMKIEAATFKLSAPLARITLFIAIANAFTTSCITPR